MKAYTDFVGILQNDGFWFAKLDLDSIARASFASTKLRSRLSAGGPLAAPEPYCGCPRWLAACALTGVSTTSYRVHRAGLPFSLSQLEFHVRTVILQENWLIQFVQEVSGSCEHLKHGEMA